MLVRIKAIILRIINSFISPVKIRNKPTILVNKSSWSSFNCSDYNTDNFDILCVNSFTRIPRKNHHNIIAYIGNIEKKQLRKFTNLQWLQIVSHGYNHFDDLSLYRNTSVVVTNITSVFSKPIAEFCYAAYHAFNCYAIRCLLNNNIKIKSTIPMPANPTITIIGLGNIGTEIAKLFKKHNWTVYGIKKDMPDIIPEYVDSISTSYNCNDYLKKSDYIINVLPETKDTIKIYNADFFKKMKTTAIFCNVGRGSAVVDSDLEYAVEKRIIRGAVLDASTSYKYKTNDVICTYHRSGFSIENNLHFDIFFKKQLSEFLNNGVSGLLNVIEMSKNKPSTISEQNVQ